MNPESMTQKVLEALQSAIELAVSNKNTSLEPQHLLIELASQNESLFSIVLSELDPEKDSNTGSRRTASKTTNNQRYH
jgi:ATP-dependent Clp protease ATP-binding subunit ClpB